MTPRTAISLALVVAGWVVLLSGNPSPLMAGVAGLLALAAVFLTPFE